MNVSWEKTTPPHDPVQPSHGGIQRINTRSRFKPFAIARWQDDPRFDVYSGEVRRDVSIYPWWNHWPTAFEPSNGRYALAADRASHSSLTHMYWKPIEKTADTVVKIHLEGMSEGSFPELARWRAPGKALLGSPSAPRLQRRASTIRQNAPGSSNEQARRFLSQSPSPPARSRQWKISR